MTVKVTDFEVFQALAMDSLSSDESKSGGKKYGPIKATYINLTMHFYISIFFFGFAPYSPFLGEIKINDLIVHRLCNFK